MENVFHLSFAFRLVVVLVTNTAAATTTANSTCKLQIASVVKQNITVTGMLLVESQGPLL